MADPTYTFDASLPTSMDMVRSRIGDTDGKPQWFLANETINAWLAKHPYDEACAVCAETVGAMCAQLAQTVQEGDLKIGFQSRSTQMYQLADRIRDLAQPEADAPQNPGALGSGECLSPVERYKRDVDAAAGGCGGW